MGYRRAVLELGGNDPLIVMEDADIEQGGDACRRRLLQEFRPALHGGEAHDRPRERSPTLRRAAAGQDQEAEVRRSRWIPTTDIGTVIDEAAARYCEDAVNEAVGEGAKLLYGNMTARARSIRRRWSTMCPIDCELVQQETFGPVSPVIRVTDIDEAIRVSNSTAYGLSSGVCTNRLDYITRFVSELRGRHGQRLGGAGLSHRDVALRRHQGFRPRLQGRRASRR